MESKIEVKLNTNIKDLITQFPEIQNYLDKFEIGCAPCNLGTCKLRDVVGIHELTAENEKTLIHQIFGEIYPGESFEIPRLGQDKKSGNASPSMSPPLRMLVDEHNLIKRVLALVPKISGILDVKQESHKQMVRNITDFIKNYADKHHHAKEEDILFAYFDQNLDIIKVMYSDHGQGRQYVANMLKAIEIEDNKMAKENLELYCQLLNEHIHKEDDILYPWMDRNLEDRQVGEMYSEFFRINNERIGVQEKYEKMVSELENSFL